MLEKIEFFYRRWPRWAIVGACAASVVTAAWLDWRTDQHMSLYVLYAGPIFFATWFAGRIAGFTVAVGSALAWLAVDTRLPFHVQGVLVVAWNALLRTCFFLVIVYVLDRLQTTLERERNLAVTDNLTGLANSRGFLEEAIIELKRASRHTAPITIAYIDLDNFKAVNDTLGHDTGDHLLRLAGKMLRQTLRASDIIARVGGDEFVVLLPETGVDQARPAMHKISEEFKGLMRAHEWPVTASIGIVTYLGLPDSVAAMIKQADAAMYLAKQAGKDKIHSMVCAEDGIAVSA